MRANKWMFNQGSGPGLRAFVFFVFSLMLVILDQHIASFRAFRMHLSTTVAYPFQTMVDAPIRFASWINASVTRQNHLVQENEKRDKKVEY